MFTKKENQQAPAPVFGGQQAIVIGSSMAGLVTARVLADHFNQVTIIERDELVDEPDARKGVPQGRQLHGLRNRGANQIEAWFPGFFEELQAVGGLYVDMGKALRWYQFGHWKLRTETGVMTNVQTRPLLEWKLRRRVAALPNVQIVDQTDVLRLVATADHSRVTGVEIRRRNATVGDETLTADLVIDASGRGSRMPGWLEDLGYDKVTETNVEMGVGYATQTFRIPANRNPLEMIYILPKPPGETRMGVVAPVEGNRWMVSLCGWQHDYPPTDNAGFLEYARSLPVPDLYEAIKDAEPLTPVASHKIPSSRRRHYDRLARFPEGLVVLGDALCSFNPIYGQGMTTASLDAVELDACLREQRAKYGRAEITGLANTFRKRVAKIIDGPWMMATGEDFRWPQTVGQRPAGIKIMHWYAGRLHTLAATDRDVLVAFLHVMNMLKPPTALFAPKMIWKVLTLRRQAAPPPAPARIDVLPAPAEVKRAA